MAHGKISWWAAARQQALVQGEAPDDDANEPNALVIAMAMLGALVCLVPLGAFFGMALGEDVLRGPVGILMGAIALACSAALLRSTTQAFLNCVALVLWGLGGGLLLFNVGDMAETQTGLLLLYGLSAALLVLGAWLAQARWIQSIMGVGFAVALFGVLTVLQSWLPVAVPLLLDGLLLALVWLLWLHGEPARLAQPGRWWGQPRWAAFADAAMVGVLGVAVFLDYAGSWYGLWTYPEIKQADWWLLRGSRWLAAGAVLLATGWLVRTWQARSVLAQRVQYSLWLAGGLLSACAWFSTGLGVVAVVAVAALLGARWRMAALCAVLALALLGQFYYSLTWSLAAKGVGLAVLGGVLLAGLLLIGRAGAQGGLAGGATQTPPQRAQLAWLLVGAVLVFGLVNWDVRGKEQVIAYGQRILVPLVPVDPRSLMQGDYVALRFEMPVEVDQKLEASLAPSARVRASVNTRGVASVRALVDADAKPAPGEVILPLKQLKGRWVLVTDAYFFPEGQGAHFERAKFGDFRVLPDGRALLVGLADAEGQAMQALPGRSIWESATGQGRTEASDAVEVITVDENEAAVAAADDAAAAARAAVQQAPAGSPEVKAGP